MFQKKLVSTFSSALFGFVVGIVFLGGAETLNPAHIGWIAEDNSTAYVAQVAFINDKWHIPLASNPNYGMDLATTLTNTGPSPLLAILQKLLAVDAHKQLFGIWILINFVLQGLAASAISRSLKLSNLASTFLVVASFTPFFLFRAEIHYWLISHFLLLVGMNFTIRRICNKEFAVCRRMTILCLISYLINPYLCAMVFLINFYLAVVIYFEDYNSRKTLIQSFVPALVTLLMYGLVDGLNQNVSISESLRLLLGGAYGQFNFNLLGFINPHSGFIDKDTLSVADSNLVANWSISDIGLGSTPGSYEGYLYLGAGTLFLMIITFVNLFYRRLDTLKFIKQTIWLKTLIIFLIGISLYSVTHRITFGKWEIHLVPEKIDYYLSWGLSLFRSSGRFMWLTGYVIIIFSVWAIDRYARRRMLYLIIALVLQTTDLASPLIEKSKSFQELNLRKENIFDYSKFKDVSLPTTSIQRILLYPNANGTIGYERVALWAIELGVPSNAFETAKINHLRLKKQNDNLYRTICEQSFVRGTIYIVPRTYLTDFTLCKLDLQTSLSVDDFMIFKT
jgi:hypothetical protein